MRSTDDLSTRARIRDTAIEYFGREGFDVSLRSIAKHAGVSGGLIIHHFGSKDGLRQACDDRVTQVIREVTENRVPSDATANRLVQSLLSDVETVEQYGWLLAYVLRSFQVGGDFTRAMFDAIVADSCSYLERAEAAGLVKPSRDRERRARWMVTTRIGAILVLLNLREGEIDFGVLAREWTEDLLLPALELYTEGLFADSSVLDTYLSDIETTAEENP